MLDIFFASIRSSTHNRYNMFVYDEEIASFWYVYKEKCETTYVFNASMYKIVRIRKKKFFNKICIPMKWDFLHYPKKKKA